MKTNKENLFFKDSSINKHENVVKIIEEYNPYNEQEENDKRIILKCMNMFEDIFTRKNDLAHITSSGFVVNQNRKKVLMVYHNIYKSWSWAGGHADGDEDLLAVSIKEIKEETGVKNVIPITNDIFSIDILPVLGHIKNGKYVSPHLHLSVAYIFEVSDNEELTVKPDENSGVKWIPIEEVTKYSNEKHMKKVYDKIIHKMKNFGYV